MRGVCVLALLLATAGRAAGQERAVAQVTPSSNEYVGDLPLISQMAPSPSAGAFALLFTGDGGWASIDRQITARLNARGINVIGFDSRAYFGTQRTPDDLARDLGRLLRHYRATWPTDRVYLIGYSRGADMLPFALARWPVEERSGIDLVALLGLEREMDFQWTLENLVGGHTGETKQILPEINAIAGMPIVCVYGVDEKDTLCPVLTDKASVIRRDGGHHFDGRYAEITDSLLAHARTAAP